MTEGKERQQRRQGIVSSILFAAFVMVLAAMTYIYFFQDEEDAGEIPPPPVVPGQHQLANVVIALREQGLEVEYGRRGAQVAELSPPGQALIVDGAPLYVFIYPDVASRERETADLAPEAVELVTTTGEPLADEPPHLAAGSNVLVALVDGSDELADEVDRAIAELP